MRGQGGGKTLRADVLQVARPAGRFPKGHGIFGNQAALGVADASAGRRLVNAHATAGRRQRSGDERGDVGLAYARVGAGDE